MSRLRPIFTFLLVAASLTFLFDGRPDRPWLNFFPNPQGLALGFLILLALAGDRLYPRFDRLLSRPAGQWMAVLGTITFGLSAYYALGPLEGIPHVPDDFCYLWQARCFAQGTLSAPSPPLPEFYEIMFMINDGKWYGLFQPGWSLFLAPFTWVGLEYFVNPLLAGVGLILVYPIGRRLLSDRIAKGAMLMMTFSPMHLSIGATLLAHALSFVLTELALLFALRLGERNRLWDAAGLGAAVGWLFLTRALNAAVLLPVVGLPILAYIYRRRTGFSRVALAFAVASFFLGLQLLYNQEMTGDAFYFPQDRYFDLTEPKKGCHRLGFGTQVGCPKIHRDDYFPDGFTPMDALKVTHRRLGTFFITLLGFNAILFFAGFAFLSRRAFKGKMWLLSVFLSLLVGYFFFYFHGLWGRYYYESAFAVFLLISAGIAESAGALFALGRRLSSWWGRAVAALVPALAIMAVAFNIVVFIPMTAVVLGEFFFGVDRRLERMQEEIPSQSLVFVDNDYYPMGFIFMVTPHRTPDKIFARDLGNHNRLLMQQYPDHRYFTYNPKRDQLVEITQKPSFTPIVVEGEHKVPLIDTSGEYNYAEFFKTADGERASENRLLAFEAAGAGSYAVVPLPVTREGLYRLMLKIPMGPDRGRFRLRLDQSACREEVDLYSPTEKLKEFVPTECSPLFLEKGVHRLVMESTGKNEASRGYRIGFDYARLTLDGGAVE